MDLRREDDSGHVTFEEGFEFCREVGGHSFIECSSTDKVRIQQIFESVVSAVLVQKKGRFRVIKRIVGR